jgi:hypothetical protein
MGRARDHLSESQPKSGGIARDVDRLKSDGAAAADELREFVGQMRGRNAQEMIGLVAESGLTRSMLLATSLFALLLAALTLIPFAIRHDGPDAAASVAEEAGAKERSGAEAGQAEPAGQPAEAPAGTAELNTAAPEVDPDRAIDAMGIGETRTADPEENPMEDRLDQLLDGIE